MLPVVATPAAVARKILWYSYAMVGATLALIPYAGWIYGVLAAALGAWFLAEAHGLDARVRSAQPPANEPAANQPAEHQPAEHQPAEHQPAEKAPSPAPMRLFHLSIAYLTLLFAAVAVTALLPWGRW
jgi:protoheme IX farnesyltransferase